MAFTMLEFGVMNNAGFTVITGEIGSGKTTLVRRLLKSLDPNITTGLISNSPQGRQELLQWILMALGRPFDGNYPVLFKRLQDFLYSQFSAGRRTMLIIDEAQNLEAEALEHLRMLSNINADKYQILQLILVGQPQLRNLLQAPELHQFAQRISSDFHLKPLSAPDVTNYIAFRLESVGAPPPPRAIFTLEACAKIAEASGGIPSHDQHSLRHRLGLRLCSERKNDFRPNRRRGHCRQATVQHFPAANPVRRALSICTAMAWGLLDYLRKD